MAPASNHDQRVFEQVSPDLEKKRGGVKKIFADISDISDIRLIRMNLM